MYAEINCCGVLILWINICVNQSKSWKLDSMAHQDNVTEQPQSQQATVQLSTDHYIHQEAGMDKISLKVPPVILK